MSLFSRIEHRASLTSSVATWGTEVFNRPRETAAGVEVGWDEARTLTAVWSCQSLIADGIASLPVDVIKTDARGRRKPVKAPGWLLKPNPFDEWYAFVHKLMISIIGSGGNAFVLTPRNSAGVVQSVWVLDPSRCHVDEFSDVPQVLVDGTPYGPDTVVHIPGFSIPGKRAGLSVIDAAREAIALGLAAEEFGARFFSQGTTMSGVIEHPGKATPGEIAMVAKMMRKTHGGMANTHAIGVLSGGATFRPISITPNEAQFLETRRFQAIQVAALYRVPPHMIDPSVQSSWGSGIEEQNAFFAEYTLIPWITRLEQAFSRLLPYGQNIKWNLDAKLRAKLSERYVAYSQGIQFGFLSPDDIREKEDLEPLPDGMGKQFFRPANLIGLSEKTPETGTQDNPNSPPAKPPGGGDSGPKAEARHLPGEHDQESHGNRVGRLEARGWTVRDRAWQLAEAEASTWDFINGPDGEELRNSHSAEQLAEIVRKQVEMLVPSNPRTKLTKGKFTISYWPETSSSEDQRILIAERLEALDKVAPVSGPVDVSIVEQKMMPDESTRGMSLLGKGRIFLSELIFRDGAQKEDPGFMPSYHTAGVVDYTLTHEWGHAIDTGSDSDSIAASGNAGIDGASDYAVLGGWRETYAEAFAEWNLTNGQTSNPMVRWYANHFGWKS